MEIGVDNCRAGLQKPLDYLAYCSDFMVEDRHIGFLFFLGDANLGVGSLVVFSVGNRMGPDFTIPVPNPQTHSPFPPQSPKGNRFYPSSPPQTENVDPRRKSVIRP